MSLQKGLYILVAVLSILIGLYPMAFLFGYIDIPLLSTKDLEIITNIYWNIGFNLHILFGGIALLIGWTQFSRQLRTKYIRVHRIIGRVYVFSALLSALAGLFIGLYATGGIIAVTGFLSLGIIWLYTTLKAYFNIRSKNVVDHQKMMVYSYATCFAAVTLRLWLPLLIIIIRDFETSYQIVAWLCWIPNLMVAYYINKYRQYQMAM